MPMEHNETTSLPSERVPALALNYAPPRRLAWLRRWFGPGSVGFFAIILALAGAGTWGAWKWRIKADEKAFNERAVIDWANGAVTFNKPPNAGSLRHLTRLAGMRWLAFNWSGPADPTVLRTLRGKGLPWAKILEIGEGVDADGWLKELSRPDGGLAALTELSFIGTHVTAAGLKELTRPDSGMKALGRLDLLFTEVTDVGLKELARPDSGLKTLKLLNVRYTPVTDAALIELARPDCGLKALTWLYLSGTNVTDAGIKALKKARPGLTINGK